MASSDPQPPSPFLKVQVWVHRRDAVGGLEVLLLKLTPERGGYWQPVTGGVDPGEELTAAAAREAREETGLQFEGEPEFLDYRFAFYSQPRGRDCEEHVFAIEAPRLAEPVTLDPREHVEFAWHPASAATFRLKHASNVEGLRALLVRRGNPPSGGSR